ncbi:hypothetical protein ACHHYP_15239 [Achlya hypogyna]|uniref:Uncharacterized protein n=1 Tax=Achlya hypogyna TaxID=1202772 RepID=A0A1V9YBE4_ACHHY|nr:hypothetical protein ACHHYP_15239 [Achlya hypogyna]
MDEADSKIVAAAETTPEVASPLTEVHSLRTWLATCMSSVLNTAPCADAMHTLVESDLQAELRVLQATIADVFEQMSRPQTIALGHVEEVVIELRVFLQALHATYLENETCWLPFTKKSYESLHLMDTLVRRFQKRSKLFLRLLAVPGSPTKKSIEQDDDAFAVPPAPDSSTSNMSAEDRPIESTFIRYHKKFVEDLAKSEAREKIKAKRRQTLATMQSPIRKQARHSDATTATARHS